MRISPEAQELLESVIARWNTIPHVVQAKWEIIPEMVRNEFLKRLHEHGKDGVERALSSVEKSEFWKSKAQRKISFAGFVRETFFQDFVDGKYDVLFDKKSKVKTDKSKGCVAAHPDDSEKYKTFNTKMEF